MCYRKHSVIETNSYIPTDVLPQAQCDRDELLGTSVFASSVPTKPRRQAEPTGMMSVLSMLTFSFLLWKELDQITKAPLGASLDSNSCVGVWTSACHQRMCDNHSLWNQEHSGQRLSKRNKIKYQNRSQMFSSHSITIRKKISLFITNVLFLQHNTKENINLDCKRCLVAA